jgi:hypothetical protein
MITQEYILKANDMNVEAKRSRYNAAICKWIRGLAQAFIAQQNIYNYNEDVAVLDLIAGNQDDILVLLGIPLPKFIAAYKAAHKKQGIPTPTIDFNFQDELDQINGTAPLDSWNRRSSPHHSPRRRRPPSPRSPPRPLRRTTCYRNW